MQRRRGEARAPDRATGRILADRLERRQRLLRRGCADRRCFLFDGYAAAGAGEPRERQLAALRERDADDRERASSTPVISLRARAREGWGSAIEPGPAKACSRRGGNVGTHGGGRNSAATPPWPGQLHSPRLSSHTCVRDAFTVMDIQEIE